MSLKPINEQEQLKTDQYHNSKRLEMRIALHRDYGTKVYGIWKWLWDAILSDLPQTAKVLEVGTGRGDMWKENQHRIPNGWVMTLTDFSDGMLEDNKVFLGDLSQKMTYNVVDVQDIPYPDNSFDIVFANMMLYHVPDRPKAIAELRRVLKADGVLISMTNGENHLRKIFDIAGHFEEIGEWYSVFKDTFSMQNGEAQLREQFSDVRIAMFDNHLWVTKAQPVIDYIWSMMSIDGEKLVNEHEDELRADLDAEIAEKGGIAITKETGVFISHGVK